MIFSSLTFIYLFLPICLLTYYCMPNMKLKNILLTFFSLIFYAWGEPVWVVMLVIGAIINFNIGNVIALNIEKPIVKKIALFSSLFINLGLLVLFKYSGLLIDTLNSILNLTINMPNLALPIGISFYTFQTLTYSIDLYRGKVKRQKSFLDFLLFVSFFPPLMSGPILRYSDLEVQLTKREHTLSGFYDGLIRFCIGLAKKLIIANHAGSIVNTFLGTTLESSTLGMWYSMIMYTVQIYFDFSGYSDMAIGLGKMFGFEYKENFRYPYISTSINDFWRRWHISLSEFFRDYVYIPLGGKYKHQVLNIIIVWALTGIWHGASWNFLLWGFYFCIILLVEKFFLLKILSHVPMIFRWLYSIILIIIGWTLFYFTDINECINALKIMFGNAPLLYTDDIVMSIKTNILFIIIAFISCTPLSVLVVKKLKAKFMSQSEGTISVKEMIALIIFKSLILYGCTAVLTSMSYSPFLYFKF